MTGLKRAMLRNILTQHIWVIVSLQVDLGIEGLLCGGVLCGIGCLLRYYQIKIQVQYRNSLTAVQPQARKFQHGECELFYSA